MGKDEKGAGFWLLWGGGVALLATLVWLGLRFGTAYADCAGTTCEGAALRTALFMKPTTTGIDEADNNFVKVLIRPPEQPRDEVPDMLARRASDAGGDNLDPQGVLGLLDPHLVDRLIDGADKNAGVQGLLRATPDAGAPLFTLIDSTSLEVRGALSKQVVRSIIDSHLTQIRYCDAGPGAELNMKRQVTVQFTIADGGVVTTSRAAASKPRDRRLERCAARAVQRWRFPRPLGGGVVSVSCSFVLTSEEVEAEAEP